MAEKPVEHLQPGPLIVDGKAVDGRTLLARRYREICADLASDLAGPSAGQWILCQRAAAIVIQLEELEGAIVGGSPVDVDRYTKLAGTLCRIFSQLGLQRRAKAVNDGPVIDAHARAVRGGDDA